MSNSPLVSIIVPIYNSEKQLRRCIDSLLSQDYSKIEVLLINDGSTDNSLSIAEEYKSKDCRIKVLSQNNYGVSRARNLGLSNVYGEYICFVDSDDYVETNYIVNFINGLRDGVDLVFQGLNEIHLDKSIRKIIPTQAYYSFTNVLDGISDINRHKMFGYVCNKLYKTSIIKENNIQFREDINLSEDRIFALQYLRYVRNMQVVAASAYNYELQESGLTLKQRSFDEIKRAADINLQESLTLLNQRDSIRFEQDTRRMYIMSALNYFGVLFRDKISWKKRYKEIKNFRDLYLDWIGNYSPITRDQKVIQISLQLPTVLSISVQSLYWWIKRLYEKTTQISNY